MARYPSDHKEKVRASLLQHAATELRAHGPDGVSVAAVMKDAGLTHGAFYAHFASKDAMMVAAIAHMFGHVRDRWARETLDIDAATGLSRYIRWYLSPAHRDAPEMGCPVAALAADLPRMSARCRAAFGAGTRKMTAMFEQALERLGHPEPAAAATSFAAELVGALSLARLEADAQRSNAILAASRRALEERLGLAAKR